MLSLNIPITSSQTTEPVWKVLIYDRFGQDIISPLVSVKELRELGVTLHLYVFTFAVYHMCNTFIVACDNVCF